MLKYCGEIRFGFHIVDEENLPTAVSMLIYGPRIVGLLRKLHLYFALGNAEALVVVTKEIGLVIADKTKYMVMSREQTAGLSHTMKVDNSSTEMVEEFKYLGTTLTNQNSIQEEIKSRLKLGNACYHSVQNLCLPVCY